MEFIETTELLETLMNGNRSDYQKAVRKMNDGELSDLLYSLEHREEYSQEWRTGALVLTVWALQELKD